MWLREIPGRLVAILRDMKGSNSSRRGKRRPGQAARKSAPAHLGGHGELDAKSGRRVKQTRSAKLRIISGSLRGRSIQYHGAEYTRPMRDNVRENLFNIVGQNIRGAVCVDLFSGTGALAFESISRGAARAIAIERSRHAIGYLKSNAEHLDVSDKLVVVTGDAFRLASTFLGPPSAENPDDDTPRIVFVCPPYVLWQQSLTELNRIIQTALMHSSPGSIIVAETDKHFDPEGLSPGNWDHRVYGNTRLSFIQPELVCGLREFP